MDKHPVTIAWHEWKARSPESFVSATLDGLHENLADGYLENRLRHAFSAGAEAQRQIYLKALASIDVHVETGRS